MALALGKTLTELEQMPERELDTWYRYYAKQPFGLYRQDFNTGLIALTMAQTVSSKTNNISDFMPFFSDKKEAKENISELMIGTDVY